MPIAFLADTNLDQDIVAGVLRREPEVDFALPQRVLPDGMKDPDVLAQAALLDRVLVTHDVRLTPRHFGEFLGHSRNPGLILVPASMPIGHVIEQILLIWRVSEPEEWVNPFRRLRRLFNVLGSDVQILRHGGESSILGRVVCELLLQFHNLAIH